MGRTFEQFEQQLQSRTGLKLHQLPNKRDGYREYWATSNGFKLFRVGASLHDFDEGVIIGMVSQPDMFELDPASSFRNRAEN